MNLKMPYKLKSFAIICICFVTLGTTSFQANGDTGSVKKELKITVTAHLPETTKLPQHDNLTDNANSIRNSNAKFFQRNVDEIEIPESFRNGFYFFIGLSVVGTFFIVFKIYRMRLSRAERKYGVHGDRTTQELTPLPMAIEDDSENEDHTVFDINRQIRVS